jgi:hypothetical protein
MAGLNFPTSLNTSAAAATSNAAKPKAEFWLNVGYNVLVDVTDAQGVTMQESRFVSLPVGIALDTMNLLPTDSQSDAYRAFQSARNGLHDALMDVAKTLKPGEEKLLGGTGAAGELVIQLRRVAAPARPVQAASNPFVMALKL